MWKKLILIGDSNTQFGYGEASWVSILSDRLQRKCDVINRGFSGYSTKHLHKMLPDIMSEFNEESIAGCVILLGSNDCSRAPVQNVPLDDYGNNMRCIIDYLINNHRVNKQRIIIVTPPPIDDEKWSKVKRDCNEESTHFNAYLQPYAQLCLKVAQEKALNVVDLQELMINNSIDLFLHDGLHLSKEGGQLLAHNLWQIISKWPLKQEYPNWRDL